MEFFQDEKHVEEYLKLAEGYDGREQIEVLKKYLEPQSTVLEIGMGPGKDLDILGETYEATGSDYSEVFLNMYRKKKPDADLLLLDARTLETERKFDCIYSNKVLIHLSRDEARASFSRQKDLLNEGGILFHAFWKGDKEEMMQGLRFVYYTEEKLTDMVKDDYEILEVKEYAEMGEGDSIYIVLRKKG